MGIRARGPRSAAFLLPLLAVVASLVLVSSALPAPVAPGASPTSRVPDGLADATPTPGTGGDEDADADGDADGDADADPDADAGAGDPDAEGGEEAEEAREATFGPASIAFRHLQQVDEHGNIPNNAVIHARDHVKKMRAAAAASGNASISASPFASWEWLGPGNIGGRINSILVNPTSPGTMLVGSATGGIFRTTNAGGTWSHLDDFMSNLAVSSLVAHPSTPNTIYAGTGEYTTSNVGTELGNRGAGVFISTDGGTSWNQLTDTATSDWWYTNRLSIDPADAETILAATSTGIWRTLNGGTSWNHELASVAMMDVDFDPTNGSNGIAGGYSGVAYYSTDSGDTWQQATGLPANAGRVELAYAASSPSIVYASINAADGVVYKSTNGGHSYAAVHTSGELLGGQGQYGNAIWVSPSNPQRLIVGGVDLFQSTDGGSTFGQISDWRVRDQYVMSGGAGADSAHADHHVIVANANYPTDTTVYFGTDGGLFSASPTTVTMTTGWQELNNNLGITQFYGAGVTPAGTIAGGTQDNGTVRFTGGAQSWTTMFGGDGGMTVTDPTNSNYVYGEYVYGDVFRSSDGGASADEISGLTGYNLDHSFACDKATQYEIADMCNRTANFIAPIALDPAAPSRLLVGGLSLWRTNDARTANTATTGPTWTAIKAPAVVNNVAIPISAIAIAPESSNVVVVGYNNGLIYRSTNATAASPTWSRIDLAAMPNRMVVSLTIDPTDSTMLYAAFGGFKGDNLYRLANGTWSDITGSGVTGLPDVPAHSVVVDPSSSSRLYLGTEIGVFTSADTGATWSAPGGGPANVPVDQLFLMDNQLVAATYGRGIFRTDLLGSGGGNTAPTISNVTDQSTTDGVAVGPLPVTVGDAQTAAGSLVLTGSSSNQALVPNANVTFGGSGASRTVTVTPVAGQTGSATITLTVSDGTLSAHDTFVLTVSASGVCTDDAREPNDTRLTAWSITSGDVFDGMACDDDWFGISAPSGSPFTATLTFVHANGDLDLKVYDPAGNLAATSAGATNQEQIGGTLNATGVWTIEVYPYTASDQNSYTLTVTLTDTMKPSVASRAPAANATGVPRDTRPSVVFSEALQPATLTTSTFKLRDTTAGVWVAATVSWDATARRFTLVPTAMLAAGHHFTAQVTSGVKDLAGNAFAGTSWSFTASTDTRPPTITGRSPATNRTGVSRTSSVIAVFSEQMRASTLTTATVRLRDAVSGAYVTATVTYDATRHRVVLNPGPTLRAHHKYTVVLSSSIRDRAGNRLAATSWSFTTGG